MRRSLRRMRMKSWGSSAGPTNLVGRSFTTLTNPKTVEELKDKVHTQEADSESYLNKSIPIIGTMHSVRQHPFTDSIIEVQLLHKWKGFNRDCYDGMTDPDEHMNAYTTHMSLYTSDVAFLCQVFPTSLKERALCWFTKLPPNFVDGLEALVSKFGTQFSTSQPPSPWSASARRRGNH